MMIKKLFGILFLLHIFIIAHAKTYNVVDFGALGDGKTDNTEVIQNLILECSKTGGEIIFPKGVFATGSIVLESNISIVLKKGAVWTAFADLDLFPFYPPVVPTRMDVVGWRSFIYAENKENISISGEGTISPAGHLPIFQTHVGNDRNRPYGIQMVKCKNIKITGITMRNSAFWMQRYLYCDNLFISGITVFNHCNLNNDGMDIDGCHNVIVSDCTIDSADDALCFKSEGERACEYITVNNCILSSTASAFKLGTGSVGGFKNMVISNCVVRPTKTKEMHHEFDLWGGIAGIDLGNVDGGVIENITISNFVIDSVETPISIRFGARHSKPWPNATPAAHGSTRNISISNVSGTGSGLISCAITGYPNHPVENINLSNINLQLRGGGLSADTDLEVREVISGYPVNRMFGVNLPAYGFYVRHAKNISFDFITLSTELDDERSAFVFEDVKGLSLTNYSASRTSATKPLITLVDVVNAQITGSASLEKPTDFIKVLGEVSSDIWINNNPLFDMNETKPVHDFKGVAKNDKISYVELSWRDLFPTGLSQFVLFRDGKEITRTRSASYIDTDIKENTKYTYELAVMNSIGKMSDSWPINIKTVYDTQIPALEEYKLIDNKHIQLVFSEPLNVEAVLKPENFSLTNEVSVNSITLSECQKVILLETSAIKPNIDYTLTVKGLKDLSVKENEMELTELAIKDKPIVVYLPLDKPDGFDEKNIKYVSGKFGQAAAFNGDDSYINIGYKPDLNIVGDMAVSVWFKLDDASEDKYYRLLSKRDKWNSPLGYELECNPAQNRLNLSGGAQESGQQGVVNTSFDTDWHHYVLMIKDKKVYLYIDGEYVATDDVVAEPLPNEVPLYIGSNPFGKDNFKGQIDELYLFNRALSDIEIEDLNRNTYNNK